MSFATDFYKPREAALLEALPYATVLGALKAAVWEAELPSGEVTAIFPAGAMTGWLGQKRRLEGDRWPWLETIYPPDRPAVERFLQAEVPVKERGSIDYRVIQANGELLWVRHTLQSRAPLEDGRWRLRGLVEEIVGEKRLELQCVRAVERERSRIGQELHDDVCQVLAGLSYLMRVLARNLSGVPAEGKEDLDELNRQLVDCMERTRSLAHGLFPAKLASSTVQQALKELGKQVKQRFSLDVSLEIDRLLPAHSPEEIIQVYRICQEAISNSIRHGQATAVGIFLRPGEGDTLELLIEDNGSGLPSSAARPEGIGLHVMTFRAKVMGGKILVKNGVKGGAQVHLIYPRPNIVGEPTA